MFEMRPLLSRVPGVANVEVLASEEREISVIVDPDRLNAAKLTIDQVAEALRATNQVTSVGRLPKDYRQYLVLATAELTSLDDVRERRRRLPAADAGLRAATSPRCARASSIARRSSPATASPPPLVSVARQIRGNILAGRRRRRAALEEYRPSLPPAVRTRRWSTTSPSSCATRCANVRDAIIIGGLLAVFVLIAFLRDWRVTFDRRHLAAADAWSARSSSCTSPAARST